MQHQEAAPRHGDRAPWDIDETQETPRHDDSARRDTDETRATRPAIALQCELTARARAYVQARLMEVTANRRDAVAALVEAYTEREMGMPCIMLGPLRARIVGYHDALTALEAELADLDRRYAALCARL